MLAYVGLRSKAPPSFVALLQLKRKLPGRPLRELEKVLASKPTVAAGLLKQPRAELRRPKPPIAPPPARLVVLPQQQASDSMAAGGKEEPEDYKDLMELPQKPRPKPSAAPLYRPPPPPGKWRPRQPSVPPSFRPPPPPGKRQPRQASDSAAGGKEDPESEDSQDIKATAVVESEGAAQAAASQAACFCGRLSPLSLRAVK